MEQKRKGKGEEGEKEMEVVPLNSKWLLVNMLGNDLNVGPYRIFIKPISYCLGL